MSESRLALLSQRGAILFIEMIDLRSKAESKNAKDNSVHEVSEDK